MESQGFQRNPEESYGSNKKKAYISSGIQEFQSGCVWKDEVLSR
jgi:hypothetical protein